MIDHCSSGLQRELMASIQAERSAVHVVRMDDQHDQLQHHAWSDGDVHCRTDFEQHDVG